MRTTKSEGSSEYEKIQEEIRKARGLKLKQIETKMAEKAKAISEGYLNESAMTGSVKDIPLYGTDPNDPTLSRFYDDLERIRKHDPERFKRIISMA